MKNPIRLDSRQPCVRPLLEHLHKKYCHQGVEFLLALVQQKFAILRFRESLRSTQSKGIVFRKRRAEPLTRMMADIRLRRQAFRSHTFINTPLYYFGPFYKSESDKRSSEILWVFLLAYLVILSDSDTNFIANEEKLTLSGNSTRRCVGTLGRKLQTHVLCYYWKPKSY